MCWVVPFALHCVLCTLLALILQYHVQHVLLKGKVWLQSSAVMKLRQEYKVHSPE
jgi:uncharacterized membrane protein YecN with MAPEG domain